MSDEKSTSGKRRWVITACAIGAVLLFYVDVIRPAGETSAVVEAYKELKLEAPLETLATIFPRDPDLVCTFRYSQVRYYHADPRTHYIPGFGNTQRERIAAMADEGVARAEDLPYLYGYVQVLVDTKRNVVVAKTWNGETNQVHTTQGDFRGSTLGDLPDDVQAALFLGRGETGRAESPS